MAWYWWLLIVVAIFGIIGAIGRSGDPFEVELDDSMNRLAALVIIDDLKYEHPEVWAKCASKIMDHQIDPPTPEQIARWKAQKASTTS